MSCLQQVRTQTCYDGVPTDLEYCRASLPCREPASSSPCAVRALVAAPPGFPSARTSPCHRTNSGTFRNKTNSGTFRNKTNSGTKQTAEQNKQRNITNSGTKQTVKHLGTKQTVEHQTVEQNKQWNIKQWNI